MTQLLMSVITIALKGRSETPAVLNPDPLRCVQVFPHLSSGVRVFHDGQKLLDLELAGGREVRYGDVVQGESRTGVVVRRLGLP